MNVADAFFVADGENRFRATEHTRGPWSPDHQHAGPPSALLVRGMEHAIADDAAFVLTRVTVELFAPVPIGTLEVAAVPLRVGRTVRRLETTLAADGRVVARAAGMAIRTHAVDSPPVKAEPLDPPLPPERGEPFRFPVFHGSVGYQTAVDSRRVRGGFGQNPTTVWIRARVPLVLGEAPSPLQRVMIAADSGNGVAVVLDPTRYTFVNADLTVYVHRHPVGEWVCVDAVTVPEPTGVGLSTSRLWDVQGPIGWALQGLVVDARPTGG
jgi:hypothetical protein